MNLSEILDGYNANTLKTIVTFLGKEPLRYKQDNVRYLAEYFPQPNRVLQELNNLDKAELIALARLAEKNGRMSAQRLESLLNTETNLLKKTTPSTKSYFHNGKSYPIPKTHPNYKGKPSFPDLIARLTCKGLLFSEKPLEPQKTILDLVHGRIIYLPDYTLKHLKEITLPQLSNPAEIAPQFVTKGSSTLFIRDLSRYGRFLQNKQTLRLTTQNQLYKDDLKIIAAQMSFPTTLKSGKKEVDNGCLYFMRRLLTNVGLGKQQFITDPIIALPDAPFWQEGINQRMQHAFQAWHDKGAWYELSQLHNYKRGRELFNSEYSKFSKNRKTILNYMKTLGTGWVSIHELIEDIKDSNYGFLFSKRKTNRSSWYYDYRETHPYIGSNNPYDVTFNDIHSESDGWDKVEADFINHMIAGPLFWMGLVDLGYTSAPKEDLRGNKHIDGYQLTEMGLWLLGMGKKPAATTESGNLVIQPNFEILMMAPFADEALLTLDQFADVSKESEHVITYELTRLTVYRGQKQGWQAPRIAQWLDKNSSQPLPQNVQRTIDEWDALHNRIVIHTHTTLIETADSDTAQQIKESIPNSRFPTPTTLITSTKGDTIATKLRNASWLPITTFAGQETAPNTVQIDQNGRITFLHPTPSIYAKGIVYPLSSETGNGRTLTETQIKATIADGQTYEQIEEELYSIHQGPLPQTLTNKLKAWAKYYGDARQESLILIEFENQRSYHQLLQDPDVTKYLTPFIANGRFLATIHPLHIETVHALLSERGVDIHEGLQK